MQEAWQRVEDCKIIIEKAGRKNAKPSATELLAAHGIYVTDYRGCFEWKVGYEKEWEERIRKEREKERAREAAKKYEREA